MNSNKLTNITKQNHINFSCIGPQRTATSWLDRALRSHPKLCFPEHVKETFFFDRHYNRGIEWYLKHFEPISQDQLFAEVGSTYFESQQALDGIKEHNPEARILITVRNPIARSFSSFGHEYAKGRAPENFFQAVQEQPRIVDSGRYSDIAPEWEEAFGRERIFYIVQEDIEADPQGQMDAVCRFLGLEPVELPEELRARYGQGSIPRFRWLAAAASRTASTLRAAGLHRVVEAGKRLGLKRVYSGGNPAKLSMTREVFDYLLAEHEPDIAWLESKLVRNFSHWRDPAIYGLQK
jgi:hypothetical protein